MPHENMPFFLIMKYIHAICDASSIINTAIIIPAGLGIKEVNPELLECNGCYVVLIKSWARYLLAKMNFVNQGEDYDKKA